MWTAMMLARCSGEHDFFVNPDYVGQIQPFLAHTPHKVRPLTEWDGTGYDTWIANGQFHSQGINYDSQTDIMGFVMDYMNSLSGLISGGPVFHSRTDMLWDVPAIPEPNLPKIIDVLIVNSDPMSGQCPNYARSQLAEEVVMLKRRWKVIETNHWDNTPVGFSLAEIGILSTLAKLVIGVANGPMWPCFNQWTRDTEKIVFLQPMRLNFGIDQPIRHVADAFECRKVLEELNWL
jgi:hypothetical protein